MAITYNLTPERYRKETKEFSAFWWIVLPVLTVIIIPVLARYYPEFFSLWFESEKYGIMELVHFLFPLLAAIIGVRLLMFKEIRSDRIVFYWILAMILGCTYLAGEEASWGQHYFGWQTSEFMSQINDQNETNLHNISPLLDQQPRNVLFVGIIVGGLIFPFLLLYRPGVLPARFNFIYPPKATILVSALVVLGLIYGSVREQIIPSEWNNLRDGEWLEVYYSFFLLYYAIFLLRRTKKLFGREQYQSGNAPIT